MKLSNKEILDLEMPKNDAGATTIRSYLKALLLEVWTEREEFSGKQPFGNSNWEYEIYKALIKAGVVEGKLDEEGYVEELSYETADNIIVDAILAL